MRSSDISQLFLEEIGGKKNGQRNPHSTLRQLQEQRKRSVFLVHDPRLMRGFRSVPSPFGGGLGRGSPVVTHHPGHRST